MNESLFREHLLEGEIVTLEEIVRAETTYPDLHLCVALDKTGILTEDQLYCRLSTYLNVDYVDLNTMMPSMFAVKMVIPRVLHKLAVIPLSCNHDTFVVATACPGDWDAREELRFVTNRQIVEYIARRSQIDEVLGDLFGEVLETVEESSDQEMAKKGAAYRERVDPKQYLEFSKEDSRNAAVTVLNRLLKNSIYRNVSDMHIEPQKEIVVIRVRIDGELSIVSELPNEIGRSVISRVKVLAKMDIAEKRRPQDGSFAVKTKNLRFDLRASSVATPYGEKIVIRFLNPNQGKVKLVDLGLLPEVKEQLEVLSRNPQGLIIITGPTGSGKNTTLCSIINHLKSSVSNIVSVEDPIEYKIEGVNQIGINPKRGITFVSVLRAVLRQDPNVIYVGEIRDTETAEIVCHAAQTGHMVFSTLHTNDAASAVTRLLNLGVDRHVLADSLTAVVAQRLSRRLCAACAEPVEPTDKERRQLSVVQGKIAVGLQRSTGCGKCNDTGYQGRIAVNELLVIDKTLRDMIVSGKSSVDLGRQARLNGMSNMWETGLKLAAMGKTTIDEMSRHVPEYEAAAQERVSDFPASILVVDDDERMRAVITDVFSEMSVAIHVAKDGDHALKLIEARKPEFVITDLIMPRLNGFKLCERIRENPETSDLPIIVMSGGASEDAECTSLELGANDFVRKPISAAALVARVRSVFRRHKGISSQWGMPVA